MQDKIRRIYLVNSGAVRDLHRRVVIFFVSPRHRPQAESTLIRISAFFPRLQFFIGRIQLVGIDQPFAVEGQPVVAAHGRAAGYSMKICREVLLITKNSQTLDSIPGHSQTPKRKNEKRNKNVFKAEVSWPFGELTRSYDKMMTRQSDRGVFAMEIAGRSLSQETRVSGRHDARSEKDVLRAIMDIEPYLTDAESALEALLELAETGLENGEAKLSSRSVAYLAHSLNDHIRGIRAGYREAHAVAIAEENV